MVGHKGGSHKPGQFHNAQLRCDSPFVYGTAYVLGAQAQVHLLLYACSDRLVHFVASLVVGAAREAEQHAVLVRAVYERVKTGCA